MTVRVRPYGEGDFEALARLAVPYFVELGVDLPTERLRRVVLQMVAGSAAAGGWVFVAESADGGITGFVNGQIDSPANDWNLRPGWAFIRETCVAPEARGQGIGAVLVRTLEAAFRSAGALQAYLTTEGAGGFWSRMGYTDTGTICRINDGRIMTRELGG